MSHGFHDTPRASFFGAERNRMFTTEHHGASLVTTTQGPGMVPAYSEDSEILACSFAESAPGGESGIVCRRIPGEQDGKEWTSLKPTGGAVGGAAWCPTNNKFYQGTGQHPVSSGQGMVAVFDPVADTCEILGGFSPSTSIATASRAIWIPTTSRVWVLASIGTPKVFAIIDPTDNSYTWLENASLLGVQDMALVSGELWVSKSLNNNAYRIDVSSLTATLVLNEAMLEAHLGFSVTAFTLGPIEYIPPLSQVWVAARYNSGFGVENWIVRLNSTTGAIVGVTGRALQTRYIYYSSTFSRVILKEENLPGTNVTNSYLTDLTFKAQLSDDQMTATKGCYCTSINKEALPVLTGPGGGRYYTVNFYGAADLGI